MSKRSRVEFYGNAQLVNPYFNDGDDIELATYIDARERYDYLNGEYERILESERSKLARKDIKKKYRTSSKNQ